ncbi:MAG: hypothetical protein ACO1QS_00635 [Verrucomicrobiota bacterium]
MPKSPSRKIAGLQSAISVATAGSGMVTSAISKPKTPDGRIMYIECKAGALLGEARIGRVTFSKTGRTLYYQGRKFQSLKGKGFKSNYYDVETGEDYWISGPKRNGGDRLYGSNAVGIDEDVRVEYWEEVRRQPERKNELVT